ncbi:UNKNOWN [Stylonychia lemnae]|uniref:Major facilitator superfamily protein n=1 Tax=Stylonychia lemnae TaxID=5949 RepID=A0A078AWN6_STYLE|nr:UNKNOWN [Stylonychia lemnae]|eukprot:CDW86451.1 UNKNOWN [Stylonychia lemnae]
MGFIVPALYFGGNGNKQEAFKKYILVQNIIVTALSVPILLAAREKPPHPPSIFGGVFILFGLIGSVIFGILLDKYGKYKLTTNIISLAVSVAVALTFWTLPSQNTFLLSANNGMIGFFLTPMLSTSYTFAVELTFPVPESISNGMMVMVSQIYGSAIVSNYIDFLI